MTEMPLEHLENCKRLIKRAGPEAYTALDRLYDECLRARKEAADLREITKHNNARLDVMEKKLLDEMQALADEVEFRREAMQFCSGPCNPSFRRLTEGEEIT